MMIAVMPSISYTFSDTVSVSGAELAGFFVALTDMNLLQNLPTPRYGAQIKRFQNQVPLLPGETIQTTGR